MRLLKRWFIGLAGLVILGLLGFMWLAWVAIAPIATPPRASFSPELVAKGEALAGGGYCAQRHTAKGG
jgi:hypothetical protein